MATIVELGDGSFLAGDPVLGEREHWCAWCAGAGTEYDGDGGLEVCGACLGSGVEECTDPHCETHGDGRRVATPEVERVVLVSELHNILSLNSLTDLFRYDEITSHRTLMRADEYGDALAIAFLRTVRTAIRIRERELLDVVTHGRGRRDPVSVA